MRLTKEQKETESPLLDNRQLRDKCVGRYEVLDKVKELFLLPGEKIATQKLVASFYEVDEKAVELRTKYYPEEIGNETENIKIEREVI